MKKDFYKNKIFVICLITFLALILLVIGIFFLLPKKETQPNSGEYYPIDYEENIFLNQAYMEFQRDMMYSYGGVSQLFNYEKDFETAEDECRFFLQYFHTVINGQYESYKDFFVENYFEEDPKFTMQMIYDPTVQFHSVSTDKVNDEEVSLYNFQVCYRIFKNNKTFREDVDSNEAVPQIYQLIKSENGEYRIFRILSIEVEDGN